MKKIELNIIALNKSESNSDACVMVLEEYEGIRRLAIIIGYPEAASIAMGLEDMDTMRPLTHYLLKDTITHLNASLVEVLIKEVKNDIYYADIVLRKADSNVISLDARPSDAIALAILSQCPIYTYDHILDTEGIVMTPRNLSYADRSTDLTEYTISELEGMLKGAIDKEDFEQAQRLRDVLNSKRDQ